MSTHSVLGKHDCICPDGIGVARFKYYVYEAH
jgi:hypothetical protein